MTQEDEKNVSASSGRTQRVWPMKIAMELREGIYSSACIMIYYRKDKNGGFR